MRNPSDPHRKPLAGGRLRASYAPELVRTANRLEVSNAAVLYEGMSLADMAHVIMLVESGIAPRASAAALLAALLEAHSLAVAEFPLDPTWGDLYQNRERYINQKVPDEGGWLRTGRARREATNLGFRLAVRWRLLRLIGALGQLAETMLVQVERHMHTLMPDYTYLQQAQPTTFGHYLLGFVYPMLRDSERLRACLNRVNLSPAGIGSVNGSRLPLDRQRVADLLGFDGIIHHTRDAMWQADIPVEIASAAVALLINIDRLAEDLQVWVTQEFSLVELDDGYSRTSVIMPQKKNPYSLTYVRGLTNMAIGQLAAMANVGRAPSGQPDSRIFAYGEVPRMLDQATEAVQLMAGVIRTMRANVAVMAHRAAQGYTQATDLADAIVQSTGLPYQSAHRVVGHLVATAIEKGVPAGQISVDMLDSAAQAVVGQPLSLPHETLTQVLDLSAIVATRTGPGGAAQGPMKAMIAECRDSVTERQMWREETEQRLAAAEANLVRLASSLASPSAKTRHVIGGTDLAYARECVENGQAH